MKKKDAHISMLNDIARGLYFLARDDEETLITVRADCAVFAEQLTVLCDEIKKRLKELENN